MYNTTTMSDAWPAEHRLSIVEAVFRGNDTLKELLKPFKTTTEYECDCNDKIMNALAEQGQKHQRDMEEALAEQEQIHQEDMKGMQEALAEQEQRHQEDMERMQNEHENDMSYTPLNIPEPTSEDYIPYS